MDMNMYDAIKGKRHCLPENRVKYYMYQLIKSIDHMHRNGACAFQFLPSTQKPVDYKWFVALLDAENMNASLVPTAAQPDLQCITAFSIRNGRLKDTVAQRQWHSQLRPRLCLCLFAGLSAFSAVWRNLSSNLGAWITIQQDRKPFVQKEEVIDSNEEFDSSLIMKEKSLRCPW